MKTKILILVTLVLIMLGFSGSNVVCARDMSDCQPPRQQTWVLHEGDRLDLREWCHHPKRRDIEPQPPIGFSIPLKPGQIIKLRAYRWGQGIRIECGKPCYDWGNKCEWVGSDIPKGSIYAIECHKGLRDGPLPWPEGAIRTF